MERTIFMILITDIYWRNNIFSFECLILKAKPEKQKYVILYQIAVSPG